jgi:hypothetical protein
LNLLLNLKTGRDFSLKKRVGKMGLFFVHAVEAEKSIGLPADDTDANDVNTPSTTSRIDGSMS